MDLKSVALRQSLLTSMQQYLYTVLNLMSQVVLAWYLLPETFGKVAFVLSVLNFIRMFSRWGITESIYHAEPRRTINQLFLLRVLYVAGSYLAVFTIVLAVDYFSALGVMVVFVLLNTSTASRLLAQFHRAHLEKQQRFALVAFFRVVAVLGAGGTAVTMAIGNMGIYALGTFYFLKDLVPSLLCLLYSDFTLDLKRSHLKAFRRPVELIRSLASNVYVLFSASMKKFEFSYDDFLVGLLLGDRILGYYAIAWRIAQLSNAVILGPMSKIVISTMSKVDRTAREFTAGFRFVTRNLLLVMSAAAVVIYFGADLIIGVLFGQKWMTSARYLVWLLPYVIAIPFIEVIQSFFYASEKYRDFFLLRTLGLVTFAGLITVGIIHVRMAGLLLAVDVFAVLFLMYLLAGCRETLGVDASFVPELGGLVGVLGVSLASGSMILGGLRASTAWSPPILTGLTVLGALLVLTAGSWAYLGSTLLEDVHSLIRSVR